MSRLFLTLIIVFSTAAVAPAVAHDDDVVFSGSGWGHGVGMSQYGAYGMALDGADAGDILRHYYRGTDVVDQSNSTAASFLGDAKPLWIGVQQDVTVVQFRISGGDAELCQAGDGEGPCPKAVHPLEDESWVFRSLADGTCAFERLVPASPKVTGSPGDCTASVSPAAGAAIVLPGEGRTYSEAILRLRPSGSGGFHVVVQVPVQTYLLGVAEMPTSWPSAALEAQAIAARSYAFAQASGKGPASAFSTSTKDRCWCHLYDDTRSQVFAGDAIAGSASWRAAVSVTNRKVVAHEGRLVTAFYSSSSGGRTENVEDVWGGSPVPWLVSVDDSAAKDPRVGNPLAQWTRERARVDVASALGLDTVTSASVTKRPSGGVESVVFRGTRGSTSAVVTRSGSWVRSTFSLPSQYFSISLPRTGTLSAYDIGADGASPIGWFDAASGLEDAVAIRGWAMDPDTALPIMVHVYVDGRFRTGVLADEIRRDVERAYGNGAAHGFEAILDLDPGDHRICVFAINAPTRVGNPSIGCRSATVSSAAPPPAPPPDPLSSTPFGWVDTMAAAPGAISLRGWAIDADAPDQPVGIHVYVDGRFAGGTRADTYRPDVDRVHGLGAAHGFSFSVPATAGSHRVCVYAIDIPTRSDNPLLACRTVSVP